MLHKQRYFDRNGREVAEHEAMRAGVLRDGFSLRIPTTLRDSTHFSDGGRAFWDANRDSLLVTDARRIGGVEGNRPGFRIFANDMGRQAIADAYAEYREDLENRWRSPRRDAAYGFYPYSPSSEGSACTVNGASGVLVREGDVLVCRPLAADAAKPRREEDDDNDEDDDNGSSNKRMPQGELEQMTSATSDSRRMLDVKAMSAAHQRAMDALYRQISEEVSQQWRRGK